ncbi:MAG TPA: CPBP family intramembrane glutamic endopeptidase [Sedimentisphaerales bacterium]|nr:CPBP family intramembrane glutamic endopeptidase [Sedimentisphaerales bacterium]
MNTSEIIMGLVFLAGALLFGLWLLKTSLGRDALADSMPRRNNMRPFLCLVPLFIWFGPVPLAIQITERLAADLQDWQRAFLDNLIYSIGAIVVIAVIIFLVRAGFARRLKGFGLNARSIHKDFFAAFVNLLSVWPLMMAAMTLTIFSGKLIYGPEYQIPQHQQLEVIKAYPQLQLRILTFVVAVVIAPVLEEMIFRGLFQTVIRSFLETRNSIPNQNSLDSPRFSAGLNRAWLSILISSGFFAVVHGNVTHWPALFVLGVCLGYAYEKSGSLFRPIFIHAFFNAITIIFVLLEV